MREDLILPPIGFTAHKGSVSFASFSRRDANQDFVSFLSVNATALKHHVYIAAVIVCPFTSLLFFFFFMLSLCASLTLLMIAIRLNTMMQYKDLQYGGRKEQL